MFLETVVPATTGQRFSIPAVCYNAVFINGPRAQFADIIAPKRVCQCKFRKDPSKSAELKLNEFAKLGIASIITPEGSSTTTMDLESTETTPHEETPDWQSRNGALLSRFSLEWNKEEVPFAPTQKQVGRKSLGERKGDDPRQFYPYGQFVSEKNTDQPSYTQLQYDNSTKNWREGETNYLDTDVLDDTVEAVFYTNGASFVIKGDKEEKMTVTREDVDVNGAWNDASKLNKLKQTFPTLKLREKVELRFIFATNHNDLSSSVK